MNLSQHYGISAGCVLFNTVNITVLYSQDRDGALLSGVRWLGCNTGVSFSVNIYSIIANECSVFDTEKKKRKIIMTNLIFKRRDCNYNLAEQ